MQKIIPGILTYRNKKIILLLSLLLCFYLPSSGSDKEKYNTTLDNVAQFIPGISAPFLGLTGINSKHSFRERMAVTITAFAIDEIIVQGLKFTIHSTRPDGTDRKSFPSGHTSLAFAGAEIMREEYGWLWGGAGYLWAIGVGALRIHHHRHRFIDVAGGAFAGFISARIGYLLLPIEKKIFKWDKKYSSVSVIPIINKNSLGGSMCLIF